MFEHVAEGKRTIQKYVDEKKKLQMLVLQIIENSDVDDTDFKNLLNFLDTHQYEGNKLEIKRFLHLILVISINHCRHPNFFYKIEKILTISSKFYIPIFSKEELFTFFQESKPVLLFFLQTKIISIDQIIFRYLMNFSELKEEQNYYYYYPELKSTIESGIIEGIDDQKTELKHMEDIQLFEINRQKFENESRLCSIIREDSIDDFIQYIHQTNISFSSQIKRSFFETNSLFIENSPTLIEYAAFFGSIKIMKYLYSKNVELSPSIWLYAVHSANPNVILFLEEKQIEMDEKTLSESIKCHHNSIANYLYFDYSENLSNLNEELLSIIFSSFNYEFFPYEIDENNIFFNLSKYEYNDLINLYLESKKNEIESYINQRKELNIKQLILQTLEENKLDIAYYLLLKFDCIPEKYFNYVKNIARISLPPTIQSISNESFLICKSLKQISIPSSVTSIGAAAFAGCSSLEQITIPSSVLSIGEIAFSGCSSLTQIIIPFSITRIENSTFNECSSLIQISIPSSVTSIGICAFKKCSSLKQITILSPVISFGNFAFWGCSALTKISILSSATSIGFYLFKECSSLVQIKIISSLIEIREGAFNDCSSLSQFSIPSSITKIENNTFYGCSSLAQITIPSSVTSIGNYAFYGCSALKQITIPSSVTEIGSDAFCECSSLIQISIPSSFDVQNIKIPSCAKIIKY